MNRLNFPLKRFFSFTNKELIQKQLEFGCHNYGPLPVVIARGKGPKLWDVEGKQYYDMVGGIGGCNQGHVHPKILKTFVQQAGQLTLISRAIHNNNLGLAQEKLSKLFGYHKSLFMNGGVQATQSAVKLARRWGYNVKKVPDGKAHIVFPAGNFWGRSLAACGASDDPMRYNGFGPFGNQQFSLIPYNDVQALQKSFKANSNIVAYFVQPIQGEKGVIIPSKGYLKKVSELCKKYNVLLICDQVQCGFGRTGKMFGFQHEGIRPDLVTLGKSLSGGFMPVSAVLGDNHIMQQIKPGQHGCTFGGNPLAAKTVMTAIDVVIQQKLAQNADKIGKIFLKNLQSIFDRQGKNGKHIREVRGVGMMLAIQFHQDKLANLISLKLLQNGVLAKPASKSILKLTPTLVLNQKQIQQVSTIFQKSWKSLQSI